MMTASDMVRRVTPPMKAPAPMSANAPGSTHDQGLGGRNTPSGALQATATLSGTVSLPHLLILFELQVHESLKAPV